MHSVWEQEEKEVLGERTKQWIIKPAVFKHLWWGKSVKCHGTGWELFVADSCHTIAEEDIGAADDEDEDSDSNNNVPKGINRLSCKLLISILSIDPFHQPN